MPEILKVDADNSEERILTRAAVILANGGIIAYPTETFYGLGADATNEKAIEKIFAVKGRNFKNPISLIISILLFRTCLKRQKNLWPRSGLAL